MDDDDGLRGAPVTRSAMSGADGGMRERLAEAFVAAVGSDVLVHGVSAVERLREKDPGGYLRVVSGVLPDEVVARGSLIDGLSDDEIGEYLGAIRAVVDARRAVDERAGAAGAGEPAAGLPALS